MANQTLWWLTGCILTNGEPFGISMEIIQVQISKSPKSTFIDPQFKAHVYKLGEVIDVCTNC